MATLTYGFFTRFTTEVAKTASYTVLNTDAGTLFTNVGAGGAVTFTLPALAAANVNAVWGFYATVAQNLIIAAPANKLVALNNSTATSLTFSTASQIIGAYVEVWLNLAGTFYYYRAAGTQTQTIA